MSHFKVGSCFCWVADKPYDAARDGRIKSVPQEVIGGHEDYPPMHLFVRSGSKERYLYVGRLGPSYRQSYPSSGNYGDADFDLRPALPSHIWQSLGGFDPGDLNHDRVDSALQRLYEKTTTEDRLEIFRVVAEYWHGPIGPEDGISNEELTGKEMPYTLRWWYRLAGGRKEIMSGQIFLLQPDRLEMTDGLLLFYVENQWCYEWAMQPAADDPPVYGRQDQSKPWALEGMVLSEFLIEVCLFEAVMCHARYGASASWIEADTVAEIAKTIRPLPIARWGWCGTQFWACDGAFANVADNGEYQGKKGCSIWVGAKTEHPLAFLKPLVSRWEFVSL
jgi:hypothetical protein